VDSAESRLQWVLSDYGLRARHIVGDGACQFRAVADQLFRDQELHGSVRHAVVTQLRNFRPHYEGFADSVEGFDAYCDKMEGPREWGDNLSLQAIADAYNIQVCLVTSYLTHRFLCVSPASACNSAQPPRQIWLGFFAEYHYTSLEPAA